MSGARWSCAMWAIVVTVAAAAPPPAPPPGAVEPTDAALHRQARDAAEAGRWDEAIEHWDALRRRHPDLAELPYNMGVAAHRKGDLERAAQLFRDAAAAASDPALRARSAYNLGTTEFQRAASKGGDQAAAAAAAGGLDEAGRRVAEALEQFRDALDQDPGDVDARANGELAQQFLERLRQLKQDLQQQQNQDQSQQQGESPDMQQQQLGGQDDQQDQGEQGQDQSQAQGEQQEQQQGEQQGEPQEQPLGQGQDQEQETPAPQAGETKPAEAPESGQQASGEAAGPGEETREDRKPMTRQEAERLLQGVRDKERTRRDQEASKKRAGKPKVDKDW